MKSFLEDFQILAIKILKPMLRSEPIFIPDQNKKIQKKFDVTPKSADGTDINKLVLKVNGKWAKAGFKGLLELSKREKNNLPWILYLKNLKSNPKLIADILRLLKDTHSNMNLLKIIYTYLKFYEQNLPANEIIRKHILNSLAQYQGRHPKVIYWKQRSSLLFSPKGPEYTARWFTANEGDQRTLERLGLKGDLGLGYFTKETLRLVLTLAGNNFPSNLENILNLLRTSDNPPKIRFQDLLPETATRLLSLAGLNAREEIQNILRPFFLKYMGDPRLVGDRVRWKGVSREACYIFAQWLSKRDLEFFFNIVDRTADNYYWVDRRKFWEAYLPYIDNTWVALGPRARELIDSPEMRSHLEQRRFGELTGSLGTQSVFFLQMCGYIFLEWSDLGACRVWKENEFGLELGKTFYSASRIRAENYVYRLTHRSGRWQFELAQWIQNNLGIKPRKTFY